MALWQLVHSPCLYSVCPLCLECHLPIFQCPNAPCLLRYTAQCHFPQEAFPDLRSEYYFRAHLHPVQPSGKVLTTLHHNDGGSIGRDQLYILRTAHQLPPLLRQTDRHILQNCLGGLQANWPMSDFLKANLTKSIL